eukprot:CAMPEP_0170625890 /NCGR_PEP_ID=MMETSP0224-20130122/31030_1 /TAXON_ID=285029 /ORGANISM="Togula jolla, Strain CCCM 725" /LENGTH=39 /DNA_ID= /DNA_START= /DNA_END= /DNA_ORIENTATION=
MLQLLHGLLDCGVTPQDDHVVVHSVECHTADISQRLQVL